MKQISPDAVRGLAADIQVELEQLRRLAADIASVQAEIEQDPARTRIYYENLALKLHNFYNGCERIFRLIVSELNGAAPEGFDWHRRLLERMGMAWQGRPALLTAETLGGLREFLAFWHVVRNIYGFELDISRVEQLVTQYPTVWANVEADVIQFATWLETLADRMATN